MDTNLRLLGSTLGVKIDKAVKLSKSEEKLEVMNQ